VGRRFVLGWGVLLLIMLSITLIIKLGNSPPTSPAVAAPTATVARPSSSSSANPTPAPTSSATPSPRPTASYVPPPPPKPFTISGRGSSNSRSFQLSSLTYTVSYSLGGACPYFAYLRSTDGSYNNGDFVNDTGPTSGAYYLHLSQVADAYFVAMSTNPGCPWVMTFTPTGG
jgi:hypothetical protein